jgi:hypothetical protein
VGERKEGWGFLAKPPSSSSLPRFRTEGGRTERAVGRGGGGRAPAVPSTAAAGEWGKMERRTWDTYFGAHLGLGLLVEGAPREEAAVKMGLTVVARCGSAVRQWRDGDGSVVRRDWREAIYSRSKAVRGGIFVLTGAPVRSWWPAGIPVARRRDGSRRATGRLRR